MALLWQNRVKNRVKRVLIVGLGCYSKCNKIPQPTIMSKISLHTIFAHSQAAIVLK